MATRYNKAIFVISFSCSLYVCCAYCEPFFHSWNCFNLFISTKGNFLKTFRQDNSISFRYCGSLNEFLFKFFKWRTQQTIHRDIYDNRLKQELLLVWLQLSVQLPRSTTTGPSMNTFCSSEDPNIFSYLCHFGTVLHHITYVNRPIRYKPGGRGFDSHWGHLVFQMTSSVQLQCGPGVDSASIRNECQESYWR
jgi:hypothetical protein